VSRALGHANISRQFTDAEFLLFVETVEKIERREDGAEAATTVQLALHERIGHGWSTSLVERITQRLRPGSFATI